MNARINTNSYSERPTMGKSKSQVSNRNAHSPTNRVTSFNITGGSQSHQTTIDTTLEQRTVIDSEKDVDLKPLADFIRKCNNFEDLKALYDEYVKEEYFNSIHAAVCFSQVTKIFTHNNGHKNITKDQFMVFVDKIFSYDSPDVDNRTFVNIANDAVKLLEYAQDNYLEETQDLTLNVLSKAFEEFFIRCNQLKEWGLQDLVEVAHLAINTVQVLQSAKYTQDENLEEIKELALNVFFGAYQEVKARQAKL